MFFLLLGKVKSTPSLRLGWEFDNKEICLLKSMLFLPKDIIMYRAVIAANKSTGVDGLIAHVPVAKGYP